MGELIPLSQTGWKLTGHNNLLPTLPLPSRAGFSLTFKSHTHRADKLGIDTSLQDTLVVLKLDLNCMCQLDWVKECPESWLKVISYYV